MFAPFSYTKIGSHVLSFVRYKREYYSGLIIMKLENKTIAILHPDLGIGGAENLILNVALAL